MDTNIVFEILNKVVIPLLGIIITAFIIPWIKSKIGAEDLAKYTEWAKLAVETAEQVLGADCGEKKKAFVKKFLDELFNSKKIVLSDAEIEVLIESAVKELTMAEKKLIEVEKAGAEA